MADRNILRIGGATIDLKAVGTIASKEVKDICIDEDFTIDWGTRTNEKKKCSQSDGGTKYLQGDGLAFDPIEFSCTGLSQDKADELQTFLFDSLYRTAGTDFEKGVTNASLDYTVTITFSDPNANVVTLQGFTVTAKSSVVIDGEVDLKWTFQPTVAPIRA